ncbi:LysR family transcriptional regulator [Calothrix sp. NIES-4071]|nr:LysR family transcriptional regulator [Calothrix sp. NIES-4071]BAZ60881.1 LysR family transcriptional regulator [Calothrix sp. NIES-4105]
MAKMTLDQLKIFLAVAEHMHFTRASEALYISQPAVSGAIQGLEEEYGVKLFHRINRHIEITSAGQLLQVEAQKILDQVALAERGLRELNNLQRGELRLGASLTIGNYWLPDFISEFKRQYPGIQVNCTLGNTEVIIAGTISGSFDLGLVEGEVQPSDTCSLEKKIVGNDCLVIVVGKTHPWYERDFISLEELTTTDWVMREIGSGTRQRFEQALQQWGIETSKLNSILEFSSGEMVKAAVENGVGATALSELMVKKEVQLGVLRPIQLTMGKDSSYKHEIVREFILIKHQQRFQTLVCQVFEKMLFKQI